MKIETIHQNDRKIAVVTEVETVIADTAAALDLMMSARYEADADRIAVEKTAFANEFFVLSTGLAGEVLQKFINYGVKLAIYGDYSHYTSKPLKDFIYESNKGKDFFFVATREEAIERLAKAE